MTAAQLTWEGDVPLSTLLAHVAPAYGDTWEDATRILTGCPAETETIQGLVSDLRAGLSFREPVRVIVHDEEYRAETGQDFSIGNGMHRLMAISQAGLEHVTVTSSQHEDNDEQTAEVKFTLTPIDGATQVLTCCCPDDDDDSFTYAHSWLRSVRLDEGVWATSDIFSRSGMTFEAAWYVPHERADDLMSVLRDRAARDGWTFSVVSLRLSTIGCLFDED